MRENTPAQADDQPADETTVDPSAPEPGQDDTPKNDNREAAKYRRQLRDTEGERDQLREQRDGLLRALVETRLGGLTPKAFWKLSDAELGSFLNKDGGLDTEAVDAAVKSVTADLQAAGAFASAVVPRQADMPAGSISTASFTDAFRPKPV